MTSRDLLADVPPDDLASYCRHALAAASDLLSEAAARRLVAVIMNGLRGQIHSETITDANPLAQQARTDQGR